MAKGRWIDGPSLEETDGWYVDDGEVGYAWTGRSFSSAENALRNFAKTARYPGGSQVTLTAHFGGEFQESDDYGF